MSNSYDRAFNVFKKVEHKDGRGPEFDCIVTKVFHYKKKLKKLKKKWLRQVAEYRNFILSTHLSFSVRKGWKININK